MLLKARDFLLSLSLEVLFLFTYTMVAFIDGMCGMLPKVVLQTISMEWVLWSLMIFTILAAMQTSARKTCIRRVSTCVASS